MTSFKGGPDSLLYILNKISKYYIDSNFEKALGYAKNALVLSKTENFQIGIGNSYTHISYAKYGIEDFEKALINLNESLAIFELLDNKKKTSDNLGTIAQIFYAKTSYIVSERKHTTFEILPQNYKCALHLFFEN